MSLFPLPVSLEDTPFRLLSPSLLWRNSCPCPQGFPCCQSLSSFCGHLACLLAELGIDNHFLLFYFIFLILKILFFWMWMIFFKSLLNLFKYCFCFMFWFFWPRGMWDLSSLTRDWTCTSCIGRWSLSHWTTREVPVNHSLLCTLNSLGFYLAPANWWPLLLSRSIPVSSLRDGARSLRLSPFTSSPLVSSSDHLPTAVLLVQETRINVFWTKHVRNWTFNSLYSLNFLSLQ